MQERFEGQTMRHQLLNYFRGADVATIRERLQEVRNVIEGIEQDMVFAAESSRQSTHQTAVDQVSAPTVYS